MTTPPYPRVVVWRGGQVVGEHALPAGAELVVGRSEGCGIVVGDGSVSRMHARLVSGEQGVYLEDLGSANGTYVDGARVQGRVRLEHGQQVRVAQKAQTSPVVLRFEDPAARLAPLAESPVDVGAATIAMRTYGGRPEPAGAAAAVDALAAGEATRAAAAQPVPSEPVAAQPAAPPPGRTSLASTTPLRDEPATVLAAARSSRSRRRLLLAVAAVVVVGGLAAAAVAGWTLLRWNDSRQQKDRQADAAQGPRSPREGTLDGAALPPAAALSPADLAPLPASSTAPATGPSDAATPSLSAEPTAASVTLPAVAGKWTARLENLFYPEDDYVVTLRLDLQQHGGALSGRGQASIENRSMTFGVPAVDAAGSVRSGEPPRVRLRLPFARPIGELELDGAFENGALAGTYRSSLVNQPGTWQAARDGG